MTKIHKNARIAYQCFSCLCGNLKFRILLILLCFFSQSHSQQITNGFKSIHQIESERYSSYRLKTDQQWDSLNHVLTGAMVIIDSNRQRSTNCPLTKRIFGWYPYSSGSRYKSFQWDKLTDFCYFDYIVDPLTGNNTNGSYNWLTNLGVTAAKTNGINIHLCVTLFKSHSTFFANASAQQTLITNLINDVISRNGKGINIDFEGMYKSTLKSGFTNFVKSLSTQLHAAIPNSELSIAQQWASNAATDFTTLQPYVDLWIHMGYDYSTGSKYAGPTAPLNQFPNIPYWLTSTVNSYLTTYAIPANKFILALPYYGVGWGVTNDCVMGTLNNSAKYTHDISYLLNNTGYYSPTNLHHDNISNTDYYCFSNTNPAGSNEFFIDGLAGMSARFDLINAKGIAGLGIWALGKDNGTSAYWNLVGNKFSSCSTSCIAPFITVQPTNQTFNAPNAVNFSITTLGSNNTNQWQINDGSGWRDLTNTAPYAGTNNTSLTINPTSNTMGGYQFRCNVASTCTSATDLSNAATLATSVINNSFVYWFDNQFNNFTSVAPTSSGNNFHILDHTASTSSLSSGLHTINVSFKDMNNKWSSTISSFFYKSNSGYPAMSARYEYWFDNNYSSKIIKAVAKTSDLITLLNVSTSNLSAGLHTINMRFKPDSAHWSSTISSFFYKTNQNFPAGTAAYEYWFNNDYNTRVSKSTGIVSNLIVLDSIATTTLPTGLHTFNFRCKPDSANWSTVLSSFFYKTGVQLTSVVPKYEYWFNSDYAHKKTVNTASKKYFILTDSISTSPLSNGLHTVNYRFNLNGKNWSSVVSSFFYKTTFSSNSQLVKYQYWFDNKVQDSVSIDLLPTTNYNLIASLNTTSLSIGTHTFHIRFKQKNDLWSIVQSEVFDKLTPRGIPIVRNGKRE